MIEIYLLEALVTFQKCGTLSAAAEELHISQPALSRSMQKLESILDVTLFERTKNRLQLTETGKIAADYAERILKEENDMITVVRNYDRSIRTLSIGSCAPGPLMEIPGFAAQNFPGITIASAIDSEENLISGLKKGIYQIVILASIPEDEDILFYPAESEHLYASVVPAHPAAIYKDTGLYFKDMDGEPFLMAAQVGIWTDITRNHMPSSRLLLQSDVDSLTEIVNTSTLSSFATDITMRIGGNTYRSGRICIPFLDDDATQNYYFACLARNENKYARLFRRFHETYE